MLDMESVGITGETEKFSYPLFQTFAMFIGMTAGLAMHFIVLAFKIPFPGYSHSLHANTGFADQAPEKSLPMWMYFLLIIPSLFDLVATAFCMFGLRYVNVSIYQMLRGSAIVFVAILKQFVLGDRLKGFMWIGVFWNVVSIILVGATAMFSGESSEAAPNDYSSQPLTGVALILLGAFVQSLQYAFEEKVMSMDIAAPPLLLIGMEGFWGTILCVLFLYPAAYYLPGADHGSYENPFNTYVMIKNSTEIQQMFLLYFFSIFFYNMFACLVTYMLNSVWHAILDNFRPITVWAVDLFIFYCITSAMGEAWTVWSWLQMLGMLVLFYGTAVYNAPNAGSIKLTGGPLHCFLDYSDEYDEAEFVEIVDKKGSLVAESPATGYMSTLQPFMSPSVRRGPNALSPRANYQRVPQQNYGSVEAGFGMQPMKTKQTSFA